MKLKEVFHMDTIAAGFLQGEYDSVWSGSFVEINRDPLARVSEKHTQKYSLQTKLGMRGIVRVHLEVAPHFIKMYG